MTNFNSRDKSFNPSTRRFFCTSSSDNGGSQPRGISDKRVADVTLLIGPDSVGEASSFEVLAADVTAQYVVAIVPQVCMFLMLPTLVLELIFFVLLELRATLFHNPLAA